MATVKMTSVSRIFSIEKLCPRCFKLSRTFTSLPKSSGTGLMKRTPLPIGTNNCRFSQVPLLQTSTNILKNRHPHSIFELSNAVFGKCVRFYSTPTGIQKHVSALVAKRPVRKKTLPSKLEKDGSKEVTAYAIAEELNLAHLRKVLETQGLYNIHELPLDVTDGLYVQAKYTVDSELREIFFFTEGSVVFWNMPEVERNEVLKFLYKHCTNPYDMNLVRHEKEHMPFQLSKDKTTLIGEVINLCETEVEEGSRILEKYTFSNALSQAVTLGVWEASLEKFVDLIEPITQDLRDGKKIRMSRREVLRRTGELFALRHVINLSSDLLDTPDFYWDRESLEPLFQKACNHLNITRRTRVMNERLSHLCELMELLSTHLNDTHHTRLEWMIIILILVEVVFEIIHYIERYVDSHQPSYVEHTDFQQMEQTPKT